MLHNPSTHNMPKPYTTCIQNMSTNAKVEINGAKRTDCGKRLVQIALTTMGAYVNFKDGLYLL